ncbi:MAG: hypothetical protein H6720_00945 [Sandaracinus sp.]|nr:hypothetical protein [Sandaracinus sp.]
MRRGLALFLLCSLASAAHAQDRIVEVRLTPTARAQIAIWIESPDGTFLRTLRLTEATARRGIGNRPGALQMNSGFHWPYGRREGVLPVWAHRRAAAQGPFQRVIFQNRASEGYASRTSNDASPDHYFCLSFNQSTTSRDALDAVTCASQFNSDKGRYATNDDVGRGYAEPFEDEGGASMEMRQLDTESLYPARRDISAVGTYDHADAARFNTDAREVMPEIDAVTMATLAGDQARSIQLALPSEWPAGEYTIYVEVNVEGDYNDTYDPERFPTPTLGETLHWDFWAKTYGYPYRGQPSVVFAVPVQLTSQGGTFEAATPIGYGSVHGEDGELRTMDGTITDDPGAAPGSGADRLRLMGDARVVVDVVPTAVCSGPNPPPQCFAECDDTRPCDTGFLCEASQCVGLCDIEAAPSTIGDLEVELHEERSWNWAHVRFTAPETLRPLQRYELRVSYEPFEAGDDFGSWGVEAKIASLEDEALVIPTDMLPGERIAVDLGHLQPQTRYYVGLRAVDSCGGASAPVVQEIVTTEIIFTTVSPCFVATAAYGTPMAAEIGVLRRVRDRHLRSHAFGAALVGLYYEVGPAAADVVRGDGELRAAVRTLLSPVVELARWISE